MLLGGTTTRHWGMRAGERQSGAAGGREPSAALNNPSPSITIGMPSPNIIRPIPVTTSDIPTIAMSARTITVLPPIPEPPSGPASCCTCRFLPSQGRHEDTARAPDVTVSGIRGSPRPRVGSRSGVECGCSRAHRRLARRCRMSRRRLTPTPVRRAWVSGDGDRRGVARRLHVRALLVGGT